MTNSNLNDICLQHFNSVEAHQQVFAAIQAVSDSQEISPILFCNIWKQVENNPETIYSSKSELERIAKEANTSMDVVQTVVRTIYKVNDGFKRSDVFK